MERKQSLSLVVAGHVDSGKSTLVGHTLLKMGEVTEREFAKNTQESQNIGKASFRYAFALDKTKDERERGVTINGNLKFVEFPNNYVNILDSPGHKNFLKNATTQIALADHMLLCVSAANGEFEISVSIDYNTIRTFATIAFTFGLKSIIVVVNKMDSVNYQQARFNEIQTELLNLLTKLGWRKEQISFIPVSAWIGANLVDNDKMPWWKEQTLLQAMQNLKPPEMDFEKPLRIIMRDDFKIKGVGRVIVGKVLCGTLSVGDNISLSSKDNVSGVVGSIELQYKPVEKAYPGDIVGINLSFFNYNLRFSRGTVIGSIAHPPSCCQTFTAEIVIVSKIPREIKNGFSPLIDCGTGHVPCLMTRIIYSTNLKGEDRIEEPMLIKVGRRALVEFKPKLPLVVEDYKFIASLGRIVVRDNDMIVALGKVTGTDSVAVVGRITKAAIRLD